MYILSQVMTHEVEFSRMTPQDFALTDHDPFRVWCLAESGHQYLVFSSQGHPFTLHLTPGQYRRNVWIDTKTGIQKPAPSIQVIESEVTSTLSPVAPDRRRIGSKAVAWNPPNSSTDWVLLVR